MKQRNLIFVTGRDGRQDDCIRQMIDSAQSLGADTYVIDFRRINTFRGEAFHAFLSRPGCAMITFQGNAMILNDGDENIWEKHHIPVYSFMEQLTAEDAKLLEKPVRDMCVLAADRQMAGMIHHLFPGIRGVCFLPFGGIASSGNRLKTMEVLIAGDCERERSAFYEKIDYLDEEGVTMITTCVAEMINNPGLSAADAIQWYFRDGKESCTEEQLRELLITVRQDIEETVNRFFKQELVQALDRAQVPLTICGKGWESPEYIFSESTNINPAVTADEKRRLFEKAKISVIFSPECHDGCFSDLPSAMLGGSLCVTESNPWLTERYQDGKHLIYMDHSNPNQTVADIQYLLSHPERCTEMARAGRKLAQQHDTWKSRLSRILDLMDADSKTGE